MYKGEAGVYEVTPSEARGKLEDHGYYRAGTVDQVIARVESSGKPETLETAYAYYDFAVES